MAARAARQPARQDTRNGEPRRDERVGEVPLRPRGRALGRPRRTGTLVPLRRAAAVKLVAPVDPCRRPRGVSPSQAEAQRRDAPRDDADAIFGEDHGADSAAPVSITALVGCVRAAARRCARRLSRAGRWRKLGRRRRCPARGRRSGVRRSPTTRRRSWRAAWGPRPSASAATARTPCVAARGRASVTAS